ncbi:ankyrin repeat-containing protein BDA1-like [Ziziphus jujuba]|uniref:Ankyrin repeat-containing protein BDA1-like n=1 Tax=Ziziphus jujuba TaxID=326968 RepID=A0ABM4A0Z8_ZIZJJ|nr:ankyrin repeat-containing protein BDA1-like [Ziziphus jujuba]
MEIRPYEDDITALFEASQWGCVSTLNILIQRDPLILDKLSLTSLTETPLHISALLGHLAFTQILLTVRPKLATELEIFIRTPLHLAAAEGLQRNCPKFVEGDNAEFLSQKDEVAGNTMLHLAAMFKQIETIGFLLTIPKVAEAANSSNPNGFTALDVIEHSPRDFKSIEIGQVLMNAVSTILTFMALTYIYCVSMV